MAQWTIKVPENPGYYWFKEEMVFSNSFQTVKEYTNAKVVWFSFDDLEDRNVDKFNGLNHLYSTEPLTEPEGLAND